MSDVFEIVKGAMMMVAIWLMVLVFVVSMWRMAKAFREFVVLRRSLGMGNRKNKADA